MHHDLEARVISVHGSEASGLAQAPLKAIEAARGFVLPTSLDDIKKLQPGESFLLVNDHDPKPLYYKFKAELGEVFDWEYLESGPDVWRVRIGKPQ